MSSAWSSTSSTALTPQALRSLGACAAWWVCGGAGIPFGAAVPSLIPRGAFRIKDALRGSSEVEGAR